MGVFILIWEWFVGFLEVKVWGYKLGRFLFNVKGGWCEVC